MIKKILNPTVIQVIACIVWILCLSKTWTVAAYFLSQPSDTYVFLGIVIIVIFVAGSFAYYALVQLLINRIKKDEN